MKAFSRLGLIAYALAGVTIIVDQISKAWVLEGLRLPARGTVPVFGPLQMTMMWNEGVSFGLLQAQHDVGRWALVVFSLVVAAVLAFWVRNANRWSAALGLGLVIGGAIGNAVDRARFGAVVDFIDVQRIGFFPWIFNVADSAITIGVILLLIDSVRPQRKPDAVG